MISFHAQSCQHRIHNELGSQVQSCFLDFTTLFLGTARSSGRLPAPVRGEVSGIRKCAMFLGVGLPYLQFKYISHSFVFQNQF